MAVSVAEAKLLKDALGNGPGGPGGGSTPRQPPPGGKATGSTQPLVKRLKPEQIKRFMT